MKVRNGVPYSGLQKINRISQQMKRASARQAQRELSNSGLKRIRAEVVSVNSTNNTIRVRRYTSLNDDGSPGAADPFDYPVVGGVLPSVGQMVFGVTDNGKPTFFGKPGSGGATTTTTGVSPNRGDADVTLTTSSERVQVFGTALTAERFVTLPASPPAGTAFTVLRLASTTGTFPLTIRDSALAAIHSLTGADSWVEVWWNGTAWVFRHSDDESLDPAYVLRAGDTGIGRMRATNLTPLSEDELITKSYGDSIVGSNHVHSWYSASDTYWFLGTLRPPGGTLATYDKIFLLAQGGAPWDQGSTTQEILIYNHSSTEIRGYVDRRGWTTDPETRWAIRGYRQADNSINFYAFVQANQPGTLLLSGKIQQADGNGAASMTRIVPGTPATATPVGTVVFDSRNWMSATQTVVATTVIQPTGPIINISAGAAVTITSANNIRDGAPNQEIQLVNVGSFAITLTNANNVRFTSGTNLTLNPGQSVRLSYRIHAAGGAANEWRQISTVGL